MLKTSCADRDSSEATSPSGDVSTYEGRGHAEMQPFDYAAARAQAPGLELGLNGAGSGGGRRGRGRGRGGRDSGGRGRGRGKRAEVKSCMHSRYQMSPTVHMSLLELHIMQLSWLHALPLMNVSMTAGLVV